MTVRVTSTARQALRLLRARKDPVHVVVYGQVEVDQFPNVTDYYVGAHAACRDEATAARIFDHYAGEERETKFAWEDEPLGQFPQVGLTRTAPQDPGRSQVEGILVSLAEQITGLFIPSQAETLD